MSVLERQLKPKRPEVSRRMKTFPLLAGAGGLCVLGIWCTNAGGPAIERDLQNRVGIALAEANASAITMESNGRDIMLAGISGGEALVRDVASRVWGVRTVSVSEPPPGGPRFRVQGGRGRVTISGQVADPELARLIREEAAYAFQGREVVSTIDILDGAATPISWPGTFVPLFKVAGRGIGDLVLSLNEAALTIQGEVGTTRAVDSLGAQFVGAAPGVTLHNGLRVAAGVDDQIAAAVAGRRIEFESGSARISDTGRQILDAVARSLAQNSTRVRIEGHTDASGNPAANRELSQARADAVLRYLTNKGVAADRLSAMGFGDARPIADNETDEGKRTNRRIEFKTSPAEGTNAEADTDGN